MLQLKIVKGPTGTGQAFPLAPGRSVTIGRADTCEVRLPSSGISKNHCRLTALSGSKAEIEDMGSSNGTFVNGLLVKKHFLKPGDMITLNDFTLAVGIEAPQPLNPNLGSSFESSGMSNASFGAAAPAPNAPIGEKIAHWIDMNINPWADYLSSRFDIRVLVGGFFLIWSVLIIFITIGPFSERANTKVLEESVQVAKLYARQLVRINQQAIIDQRYRDLIVELDARRGQTPGVLDAMILDATKAQILAPTERIGQALPNKYAGVALNEQHRNEEFVQFESDDIAYASAPIRIGTTEGNKTAAMAFVVYNPSSGKFHFGNLLDQAVNSLLIALFVSILLFILLYRWLEGSITTVSARIDEAMKKTESVVANPVLWPALTVLCEHASSALAKAAGGGGAQASETDWAVGCVNTLSAPAAALDSSLTVIAWNADMERIIGIRANLAIGSDISGASRDISFESAVRELAGATSATPWSGADKKIEFAGRFYKIAMVTGNGAHFVTILPVED